MSKKISFIKIKEIFNKVGLELLDSEAKGIDYKYNCKDLEGYLYQKTVHTCQHTLKKNKIYNVNVEHTFSTKNPYFYENMILYMNKIKDSGTKLLTTQEQIKNIKQPLTFRCGICGREFDLPWHSFVSKKEKCCNICFRQKRARGETNTKHIDSNKFHLQALENGVVILDGTQIKYHDKITVQDKEGYRGLTTPAVIMRGEGFEKFGYRNPYALDNARIFAFKNNWDCVIYNQEYKGHDYPFKVMCSCGNDFWVDMTHFTAGKYQCNECRVKQSAIAAKVELWLNQNHISYKKEKTFADCKYKKCLPFDFYLLDYNACIEVDGIGHYRPIAYRGDKQRAQIVYEERVRNDQIKNNYCENNNIPLLRLPFWVLEQNNHTEVLQEFICKLSQQA